MIRSRAWTVRYLRFRDGRVHPSEPIGPLELSLEQGEKVLVVGPCGSGKSTLALSLSALIPHSLPCEAQGELWVLNKNVLEVTPAEMGQVVGLVFQDPDSQLVMPTVEEEVAFGMENLGWPVERIREGLERSLRDFGLLDRRTDWVNSLSGGWKQKLALASVLAMDQSVLVLDEPTSQLDPRSQRSTLALLRALIERRSDLTMVVVEHRVEGLLPLVNRVVALDRHGQLLAEGDSQTFFEIHAERLQKEGIWLPTRLRQAARRRRWSRGREVLHARGLAFRYPGSSRMVLRGVNLSLYEGEVCALVGANGSGKTTLALALAGLIRIDSGELRLSDSPRIVPGSPPWHRSVGLVFQNPEHQFLTSTLREEVRVGPQEEVLPWLERVGLAGRLDDHPMTLSQGQKRLLSVITELGADRRLLILDEPTLGQDPNTLELIDAMIDSSIDAGGAVLVISHDLGYVTQRADRVIVLSEGTVLLEGTPEEVFSQEHRWEASGLAGPWGRGP